jgi:hypothetical protein
METILAYFVKLRNIAAPRSSIIYFPLLYYNINESLIDFAKQEKAHVGRKLNREIGADADMRYSNVSV